MQRARWLSAVADFVMAVGTRCLQEAKGLTRASTAKEVQSMGLRSAMLQYEIIVDDAVGQSMRKSLDAQRQEVAS